MKASRLSTAPLDYHLIWQGQRIKNTTYKEHLLSNNVSSSSPLLTQRLPPFIQMAALIIGTGALIYIGARASSKRYQRRLSVKGGYEGLPTDSFGRPVDPDTGKRISKNQAKAIAQFQRQAHEEHLQRIATEEGVNTRETLPSYGDAKKSSPHTLLSLADQDAPAYKKQLKIRRNPFKRATASTQTALTT